jgi:hypothetical protein
MPEGKAYKITKKKKMKEDGRNSLKIKKKEY